MKKKEKNKKEMKKKERKEEKQSLLLNERSLDKRGATPTERTTTIPIVTLDLYSTSATDRIAKT